MKATLTPTNDSVIQIELWLPTAAAWNGKFLGVGNSGLNGEIAYTLGAASLVPSLNFGYATAGTDAGHFSSALDGSWAIGHPKKVKDYGSRAIHLMTLRSKAILNAFYGDDPDHSYFHGCSNGGREGLLEAQQFPNDYDGIISAAPVAFLTHVVATGVWVAQQTKGLSYIPAAKLPAISAAVLAQCDTIDGLQDGLLTDPRRCNFDPATIQCPGVTDTASCLTAPQVIALRGIYRGPRNPRTNDPVYPGFEPGGELGGVLGGIFDWSGSITGAFPYAGVTQLGAALDILLGSEFIRGLAVESPSYDVLTYDFDADQKFVDDKLASVVNATDPNLSAFRQRGGKILMYHGWSDAIAAPRGSVQYYRSVVQNVGSPAQTRDFLRLFMVPGGHHCAGGSGPWAFDGVSVLDNWVSHPQTAAPESILAVQLDAGGVPTSSGLLCRFPRVARYDGSGPIQDASNYTCVRRSDDEDQD